MINEPDPNDGCDGVNPSCYPKTRVLDMAKQCPGFDYGNNDQTIVVFNSRVVSSNYAVASALHKLVYMPISHYYAMIHEFGHSFGNFGDEYYNNQVINYDPLFPNCAGSGAGFTCNDKWGDLIGQGGVDCFAGCGVSNWYRPTDGGSVMKSPLLDHFCLVGKRHVDYLLNLYKNGPDLNPNCILLRDNLYLAENSHRGDPNYDVRVDFNKDSSVNNTDVAILGLNFNNDKWCERRLNSIQNPRLWPQAF